MIDKQVKWLIYTVLVGLIPIISRLIASSVVKSDSIPLFSASDLVAFGLVLHISNINEIEHINSSTKSWKTVQNGISLAFICFYSVLFCVNIFGEGHPWLIDIHLVKVLTACLCLVSLFLSYTVYYRKSYDATKGEGE